MKIENIIKFFDFKNYDYYYHITGMGIGDLIFEEGLLVDGTNIKNVKNLKDTTTIEITPDLLSSTDEFIEFVDGEINNSLARDTSEMIIIGSPKDYKKQIVSYYSQSKDGNYYRGIINKNLIMGYINNSLSFIPNDNYAYGNEYFEDSLYEIDKLIY